MVSKHIAKGELISDVREILRLANEKKSVIQAVGYANTSYIVRPASFYLGWPLRLVLNSRFYYSIKVNK